jgi:hypothetical protein
MGILNIKQQIFNLIYILAILGFLLLASKHNFSNGILYIKTVKICSKCNTSQVCKSIRKLNGQ